MVRRLDRGSRAESATDLQNLLELTERVDDIKSSLELLSKIMEIPEFASDKQVYLLASDCLIHWQYVNDEFQAYLKRICSRMKA